MNATKEPFSFDVLSFVDELEAGAKLSGSKRRYDLLRYLVDAEINGRGGDLQAYAIAQDVLG